MKWLYHWLLDRKSWRAVYADGKRSVRMRWTVAWDYATIFKSKGVEFDPE